MNSYERRLEIYRKLLEEEYLDVNELAQLFDVTPMTIRRDLALYEKQGILKTAYGGAYLNQEAVVPDALPLVQSRLDLSSRKIGEAACSLLTNGNSIFIDSNILPYSVVMGLGNLRLTVVTTSLDVANVLRTYSKIKLIVAPGTYSSDLGGIVSSVTITFLRQYSFDFAFIGGKNLDVTFGLTVEDETDAHLKATVADNTKHTVILMDSDSIGTSAFAQAVPLRRIHTIITDANLSEEYRAAFEHRGIQLIAVE
ncbi:MAG: DeoR/GlpR family DNA-binding transcription regulator [Christensenella sp.]|nr:DeoR/GlpR family DNA-binding transcription regulator [Christensenella sp.]